MKENLKQQRMYSDLSWVWPIISPPEDYVEESQQFLDIIRKFYMGRMQANNGLSFFKVGSSDEYLSVKATWTK